MRNKNKFRLFDRFQENRPIYVIALIIGLLFIGMTVYFGYILIFQRTEILAKTQNNRYDAASSKIIRGNIETIDGVVIAENTVDDSGNTVRYYPYGALFTAVTGYTAMGKTGLEATQNQTLMTSSLSIAEILKNDLTEVKSQGDTLVTTIDSDLQNHCYQLLSQEERTGAIIVMDPSTGKILADVTYPTFDANYVKENWSALTSDDNTSAQLMNRATQGLYAPGSTFKIITAIEYMKENPDTYRDYTYTCKGYYELADGTQVKCGDGTGHGEVDLVHAMAYSCNAAFIDVGYHLNRGAYRALINDLGFGKTLISEVASSRSTVTVNADSTDFEMAMTSFGQGNTMETPLQNILITSMIANNGVMMKPTLIDHVENADGETVSENKPVEMKQILSESECEFLKECLIAVVNEGTTPQAASTVCQVAGKSGSAQYSSSLDDKHAWFTAFAPADDPEISVVVLLEKGGSGSIDAGPLISDIVTYYLTR